VKPISNKMKSIVGLIFICLILPSCEQETLIKKWEVFDIPLEAAGKYDNPYMEMDVTGSFTSPSGKEKSIRGFWNGSRSFVLRFTPDEEGAWTYTISNNMDDRGLQKSGKLIVEGTLPGSHGFVRRDARHPYHFVYDDGTRYYMCGTTYYNILLNALAGDHWKSAIDSVMPFGINKFRAHAIPRKNEVTPYPQAYPFEGKGDSLDHTRLNPEHWKKLDDVVAYANERGMVADLMPFGFERESYSGDSLLDQRYLRYIIARYAAYPNLIWCIVNEWNYRRRRLGLSKPYFNMMGETIREEDPWMKNGEYLRPLSIHQQTRIDFQFFNYDWPVHAIIQLGVRSGQGVVPDEWDIPAATQPLYRHGDEWGNAGIVFNLGHDMPVVNDEYGYMGEPRDRAASDSHNRDEWPAFTRERHRNVIWGIALGGGYGSAGDKYTYDDGRPYFSANWHSDPKEYSDIKHLVDFFITGGLEYWKMSSHNELITAGERVYAFAEPGRSYVFYAAVGGSFSADIVPGDYNLVIYDPRTGESDNQGTITGGRVDIATPDDRDWIIYLKNTQAR
jgi:hypothetical protein